MLSRRVVTPLSHTEKCRREGDAYSSLAQDPEHESPTQLERILTREAKVPQQPRWRSYCGSGQLFGYPDPTRKYQRFHEELKDFERECQLRDYVDEQCRKRAAVIVRRKRILEKERTQRLHRKQSDAQVAAERQRFVISPSAEFRRQLPQFSATNVSASPTTATAVVRDAVDGDARVDAASAASNHTSEKEWLRPESRSSATVSYFSLAFDLDDEMAGGHGPPTSLACTQAVPSLKSHWGATGALRHPQPSQAPTQFSVSSLKMRPASVGEHMKTYRRPHSARRVGNNEVVAPPAVVATPLPVPHRPSTASTAGRPQVSARPTSARLARPATSM